MNNGYKLTAAVPLILLLAACNGAGNRVDNLQEIEATTDIDVDGDGTITEGAFEVNEDDDE
ncbi:hypothetical protein [Jannaschia aquimarina]|uniref:EF-hand domain-containing protein n=1 Tax=Jannaschia aquimarina TaxID=935700 RepID=A0A0D1CS74_9RHOB|nr:hypothetical protein [Jannaschia aquimarina]KIT17642.1 hypothetical protein jaqu_05330 [Jannaschia aquimarina]SNS80155.1 hypothetical protein SAMN05421775_102348 [Jannaschia aquimarina]